MNSPASARSEKPANKRGAARLAAVQALYQMELSGGRLMETVSEYEAMRLGHEVDGETYLEADPAWFRAIVSGVVNRQRGIDPVIHAALPPDWPLARIDTLLRAILRAGVYELTTRKDVPARVIISEYVDVAKAFFETDESGMVNAVLDRIARDSRQGEVKPQVSAEGGGGEEDSP